MTVTCEIAECAQPRHGKRWCEKHYRRWLRYGNPLTTSQPYLGNPRARFDSKVDRSAGPGACHPWTGTVNRYGYGQFRVDGRTRQAHVVAWEYATGHAVPTGMHLDHECHNRAVFSGECQTGGACAHRRCCNPWHLKPKTPKQHKDDSDQTYHSHLRGDARYWATKITDAQVTEIRELLAAGITGRAVARRYGVSEANISLIKHWKARA